MEVRAVGLLAILLGCGRLSFDPLAAGDGRNDAVTPLCANWGAFGSVQPIAEFAGGIEEFDTALRGDKLEIWFVEQTPVQFQIQHGTRASTAAPFSGMTAELQLNDVNFENQDPNVTQDGLEIYFISTRPGDYAVFHASRASIADSFGVASIPAGLETVFGGSVAVTDDGSGLYVADAAGAVVRYPRITPDSFGAGTPVSAAAPLLWPTISADELEVFYSTGTALGRMTRDTPSDAFTNPEAVDIGGLDAGDPSLTVDGTELWFERNSGLSRIVRACQG